LTSTLVLTEKYPLPSRFHRQRSPEVVEKATQNAVQNTGRTITTTATYRFLSNATTKHAAIFDDIMRQKILFQQREERKGNYNGREFHHLWKKKSQTNKKQRLSKWPCNTPPPPPLIGGNSHKKDAGARRTF